MKKIEAIARLKPLERRLLERGIKGLYLFGSTARDEADAASDLDLLYEYDPSKTFSLFDQAGAMLELSDELGTKVDLVSRVGLRARVEGRWSAVFDGGTMGYAGRPCIADRACREIGEGPDI